MFLSAEGFPQAHRILGIVNTANHLAVLTEAIDLFGPMDQLFSDVQEELKRRASEKSTDGVVGIRFTTDVTNVQVVPKFLILTAYGTMVQLVR